MSSNNNRYDDEFKASAVAKDLGVSEPALRRWVKASTEPEDTASKKLAELEAEN
ncbi:MAG: transposase [Clostridiaceae bacterium]|nr:transposase [Clostridiaceae bacterium]